MALPVDDTLSGDAFIVLVALAALCGWLIVRALRRGQMDLRGRHVIDRVRQPVLFWGLLAFYAALPIAWLAYILLAH
ncbi:hypothetical protein [Reyranella sp.]|jgi:hypothetical protein|uniref:hypothetical protein n=1 Tax=Reyranella sp. TaxID=1929291 RepID=UPI002F95EB90